MHAKLLNFHAAYSIVQKLSNKQSAKVFSRFDRLRTSHSKRQKSHMSIERLSSSHPFNYVHIAQGYPSLISCEDLATALMN